MYGLQACKDCETQKRDGGAFTVILCPQHCYWFPDNDPFASDGVTHNLLLETDCVVTADDE